MIEFIVASTGRSGTVFLARFLTSIEVPCCHEGIFNYEDDAIILERLKNPRIRELSQCSQFSFKGKKYANWVEPTKTVADSSYLSVPYLNHPLVANIPVIHLIRNPIDVISSFVLDFNYFEKNKPNTNNIYNELGFEQKIWENLPELSFIENQLDRAIWFYYSWNRLIENACKYRKHKIVKIENLNKEELCEFVKGNFNLLNYSFNDKTINSNKKDNKLDLEKASEFYKNLILSKMKDYNYRYIKL